LDYSTFLQFSAVSKKYNRSCRDNYIWNLIYHYKYERFYPELPVEVDDRLIYKIDKMNYKYNLIQNRDWFQYYIDANFIRRNNARSKKQQFSYLQQSRRKKKEEEFVDYSNLPLSFLEVFQYKHLFNQERNYLNYYDYLKMKIEDKIIVESIDREIHDEENEELQGEHNSRNEEENFELLIPYYLLKLSKDNYQDRKKFININNINSNEKRKFHPEIITHQNKRNLLIPTRILYDKTKVYKHEVGEFFYETESKKIEEENKVNLIKVILTQQQNVNKNEIRHSSNNTNNIDNL
jgi:hypothetical protein